METTQYLTDEEVCQRLRELVTVGTLRNWRYLGIGPSYVKIGKAVLYPLDQLIAWERSHLVNGGSNNSTKNNGPDPATRGEADNKDKTFPMEDSGDE